MLKNQSSWITLLKRTLSSIAENVLKKQSGSFQNLPSAAHESDSEVGGGIFKNVACTILGVRHTRVYDVTTLQVRKTLVALETDA